MLRKVNFVYPIPRKNKISERNNLRFYRVDIRVNKGNLHFVILKRGTGIISI